VATTLLAAQQAAGELAAVWQPHSPHSQASSQEQVTPSQLGHWQSTQAQLAAASVAVALRVTIQPSEMIPTIANRDANK
jgi:hypothetical protein